MFLRKMEGQVSRDLSSSGPTSSDDMSLSRRRMRRGNMERKTRVLNVSLGPKNTGVVDESTAAAASSSQGGDGLGQEVDSSLRETIALKVRRLYQEISLPERSDFATEIGLITDNIEDQVQTTDEEKSFEADKRHDSSRTNQ